MRVYVLTDDGAREYTKVKKKVNKGATKVCASQFIHKEEEGEKEKVREDGIGSSLCKIVICYPRGESVGNLSALVFFDHCQHEACAVSTQVMAVVPLSDQY